MDSPTSPQYTTVLSPTTDEATVDATRNLIAELRADGHSVDEAAAIAAEHLTDVVAAYSRIAAPAPECVCETGAGVAECPVHADYDPSDAELERAWNGPDAHEAHRAAWRLHQELRS